MAFAGSHIRRRRVPCQSRKLVPLRSRSSVQTTPSEERGSPMSRPQRALARQAWVSQQPPRSPQRLRRPCPRCQRGPSPGVKMSPVRRPVVITCRTAARWHPRQLLPVRSEITQHHGGGENLRDRIGDALARDVRRGAAARLEHSESGRSGGASPSLALGSMPSEPAIIAISSLRMSPKRFSAQHHVEAPRVLDELHRGVVHVEVIQRHVRILLRHLLDHAAPEHAVFEHVRLVDRGDPALSPRAALKATCAMRPISLFL